MLDDRKPRRVVPRWRSSWVTALMGEAVRQKTASASAVDLAELEDKKREFQQTPSVPIASELMFLGIREHDSEATVKAAAVIIAQASKIGNTRLYETAQRLLKGENLSSASQSGVDFVRQARRLLAIDYRNPVLLVDVARELTSQGHDKSALRYIRSAIALAPHNRFVVRSVARFFLHIKDVDQAHWVLKHSLGLSRDPWLQASEIAVATVRGRTSIFAKRALRYISDQKNVRSDQSELASAVATVEMLNGAEKKAKRLFQQSLQAPNDNSLAQAEWASARLGLVLDESALKMPFSFEANSNHEYRRLRIPEAIAFAKDWSEDEPFSSRPLGALAFLYSIDESFTLAREAATRALRVDGSEDFVLSLNVLFARIQEGDFEGTEQTLQDLGSKPQAKEHAVHLFANAGAMAYASKDWQLGRDFYENSIKIARRRGDANEEALARAFFARAATMYCDPNASSILSESAAAVEKLPSPAAIYVVKKLVDSDFRKRLELVAEKRVAKRHWQWDATTNTLRALE